MHTLNWKRPLIGLLIKPSGPLTTGWKIRTPGTYLLNDFDKLNVLYTQINLPAL